MSSPRPCPRCGQITTGAVSHCSKCGSALGGDSLKRQGWKFAIGGSLLALGVVWGAANFGLISREQTAAPPLSQPQTFSAPAPPRQAAQPELSAAQHLAEAKEALADGHSRGDYASNLSNVRAHLEAIHAGSAEFGEAQRLLGEIARHELAVERAAKSKDGDKESEGEQESDARDNGSNSRAASSRGTESTPGSQESEATVYITRTGSKYHRAGCRYLSRSQIPISLSDARRYYSPCLVCNPPK